MPTYVYTDAEEATPLQPGEYTLEIFACEEAISTSGGNPMLKLKCSDIGGQGIVRDNLVFSQAAFWRVDLLLKSIGYVLEKNQKIDVTPEILIGKKFRAVIGTDIDQKGQKWAKIFRIIPKEKRDLVFPGQTPSASTGDKPAW